MSNRAIELKQAIIVFRKKVDETLRMRRVQKNENMRIGLNAEAEAAFRGSVLSPDIKQIMEAFAKLVQYEKERYKMVVATEPVAQPGAGEVAIPLLEISDQEEELTVPALPAVGHRPQAAGGAGKFTQGLAHDLLTLWPHSMEGETPLERFTWLFEREMGRLGGGGENDMLNTLGAQFVPKLKKALEALRADRSSDAITILKTSLRSDPHNQVLAFLVSQILYLQAGRGQKSVQSEARELAQKSMLPNDKMPEEVLIWYEYHSISCEINHSPERALEWLRETDMLNPKHLLTAQGWMADEGCYLKAWFLLAQIPVELWGEREVQAIGNLVWDVVGGGVLYFVLFRDVMGKLATTRKDTFPQAVELETALANAHQAYSAIAPGLEKLAISSGNTPWLVRNRLLSTLAQVSGTPGFDHVLLHTTLGGESWQEGVFPDNEAKMALEDATVATWRWWAGAISPVRQTHLPSILPVEEAVAESNLQEAAEKLLKVLQKEEQKRVQKDVWEKVLPWLVRWQMDHLLAAGSGSSKPRLKFIPSYPPYSHFYRRWSDPVPTNILGSEIILENAKNGAFASWYEVMAAFEGAWRLIDDPTHGLTAVQKRALRAAKEQDPNSFAGLKVSGSGPDMSKLGVVLLPLGLIAGVVVAVSMTRNIGQAIGVILVLAGLAGVLTIQISKK
ncbi:MAG: hypothetical protein COY40_00855 [Alphaproteobacteria bacterium CG_4_10_14_0_8_um_filter_53_9]|nr:MAG: hypothetical protein COY40_00855 [Alphaproteobacteria bacterium CG_4_10_14_0_8_um_filter_53_9]